MALRGRYRCPVGIERPGKAHGSLARAEGGEQEAAGPSAGRRHERAPRRRLAGPCRIGESAEEGKELPGDAAIPQRVVQVCWGLRFRAGEGGRGDSGVGFSVPSGSPAGLLAVIEEGVPGPKGLGVTSVSGLPVLEYAGIKPETEFFV